MTAFLPIIQMMQEEIKQCRRILNFFESEKFKKAFDNATDVQKATLLEFARSKKERALKELVEALVVKDYTQSSLENLRVAASAQGIPYYSSLTKAELIKELTRDDVRGDSRRDPEGSQVGGLGRKPAGHTTPAVPNGRQFCTGGLDSLSPETSSQCG